MGRHRQRGAIAAAFILLAACGCLTPKIRYEPSAPPRDPRIVADEGFSSFMFYTGDRRVPGDLLSKVELLRRPDGVEVLLVAMVHYADRSYYDAVARRLAGTDVVLLEGAAETGVSGGAAGESGRAGEGGAVLEALGLVPQPRPEAMGPRGPRYAPGDVDRADLAARIAVLKSSSPGPVSDFPTGLFNWDRFWYAISFRSARFRRAWRHQFANRLRPTDEQLVRSVLIDPRNERLLSRVDEEAARRPKARPGSARGKPFRIAVPWGSEHMAGIEQGLEARGFRPVSTERLAAWRVRSYDD